MIRFILDQRAVQITGTLRLAGRALSFGTITESFAVLDEQRAPSADVTLDNGDGALTRYALTWLGEPAEIVSQTADITAILSGVITAVTDGSIITATIDAGSAAGAVLLQPLPVRRTSELSDFAVDAPIPYGWGRVATEPLPLDREGARQLVTLGAIGGIDEVTRENVPAAFEPRAIEIGGQTAQVVDLPGNARAVEGEQLRVGWRGRRTAVGGSADTAADIIADLMTIAGASLQVGRLSRLRSLSSGQPLAGVAGSDDRSVAELLDAVTRAVGAVWAEGLPEFARPYPAARAAGEPIRFNFTPSSAPGLRAEQQFDDLQTVLRIAFARPVDANEPDGLVVLRAPSAVSRYGERILDVDMSWATRAADVVRHGTALLQHLARPRVVASIPTAAAGAQALRLGDWVTVDDGRSLADGLELMITGRARELDQRRATYTATASIGPVPSIEVESVRQRLGAVLLSPALLQAEGDIAVFTLLDPENDQPLTGVEVRLDTGAIRRTDAAGVVQFDDVSPGPHSIVVLPADREPFRYDWVQGA